MPTRPRMIVAGAPEHVGRHLVDAIRADYRVFGIADRPQSECGAPSHPNITWFEADVADRASVEEVFREIGAGGEVDLVIYLTLPRGEYEAPDDEAGARCGWPTPRRPTRRP